MINVYYKLHYSVVKDIGHLLINVNLIKVLKNHKN
jgi:hypothetical protein